MRRTSKLPIAFCLAALAIAGWSIWAIYRSSSPVPDADYYETYFAVLDLPYYASLAALFVGFGVIYALFHRLVGVAYRRWLGVVQFLLLVLGAGLILAESSIIIIGMPVRYIDYPDVLTRTPWLTRTGYIVTAISVVIFAIVIGEATYRRIRHGRAPQRPDDRPADHF
jgi:heme/copper-type cytochrome/quinol oxidase subunit 1